MVHTIMLAFIKICCVLAFVWASHAEISVIEDRCTTIIVGAKAGIDGPMTTHTSDCSDCDFRLAKVPRAQWPKGSNRPLYLYKGNYPSTVSKNRGETWLPSNLEGSDEQKAAWGHESVITGWVPQVEETFALVESGYGIMNEFQVAIGESTCAARFWAAPTTAGGKAQIEVREMSRLALERTKTARDAIKLMGSLAEQYGFYAADWSGGDASLGEGGEALTVIDKTEAWVFHVLSDDTGTSAVWAAQRVPDDHVAAVANQFVIRGVDPSSDNFLFSKNLWEVAKRNQLWDESKGLLDFLKTYAPPRAHSPYATRRVWRVFDLVNHAAAPPPFTDMYGSDYPFSVKSEKALSAADIMRIHRDHYEGTQFDLTKGIAAGPYGDPNRFDMSALPDDNMTIVDVLKGSYERSISLFRTSYSFVATARSAVPDDLALLWFSQYAPFSSSYSPVYIATLTAPLPFMRGNLFKYDPISAFWNFCAAGNYAARFYKFAMVDVAELQQKLQDEAFAAVEDMDRKAQELLQRVGPFPGSSEVVAGALTAFSLEQALVITWAWKDFLPKLITKYHDGYRAENLDGATIRMKKLFYPKWWLEATGYFDNKANSGPGVIMFASRDGMSSHGAPLAGYLAVAVASGFVAMLLGFVIGTKWRVTAIRREYLPINL